MSTQNDNKSYLSRAAQEFKLAAHQLGAALHSKGSRTKQFLTAAGVTLAWPFLLFPERLFNALAHTSVWASGRDADLAVMLADKGVSGAELASAITNLGFAAIVGLSIWRQYHQSQLDAPGKKFEYELMTQAVVEATAFTLTVKWGVNSETIAFLAGASGNLDAALVGEKVAKWPAKFGKYVSSKFTNVLSEPKAERVGETAQVIGTAIANPFTPFSICYAATAPVLPLQVTYGLAAALTIGSAFDPELPEKLAMTLEEVSEKSQELPNYVQSKMDDGIARLTSVEKGEMKQKNGRRIINTALAFAGTGCEMLFSLSQSQLERVGVVMLRAARPVSKGISYPVSAALNTRVAKAIFKKGAWLVRQKECPMIMATAASMAGIACYATTDWKRAVASALMAAASASYIAKIRHGDNIKKTVENWRDQKNETLIKAELSELKFAT